MTDQIFGTNLNDILSVLQPGSVVNGLAGDDEITGGSGNDTIFGDFQNENLLTQVEDANSFADYANTGDWQVANGDDGHSKMTQVVTTEDGVSYSVSFESAANLGAGYTGGAIEVVWNGDVVGTFTSETGVFETHSIEVVGTGGEDVLTFRSVDYTPENGPTIMTDGPINYYETTVEIAGQEVTVNAVAPGQPGLYQVLNGTLHTFDVETQTYIQAGSDATVTINGIGFNQEDDLFYGIAVSNGTDSLGNPVERTDIMMIDAHGNSYRIGEGPYASWTGDFDDQGNLWSFHSSMDRITVIDVDQFDADGNPVVEVFKFPNNMITERVWDVAYNAETQQFMGLVGPSAEGEPGQLMIIDISNVENGGEPEFSFIEITGTMIDGTAEDGLPRMTFGSAVIDGDGNLYVGGNGGDHDMNDATGISGGIYRVVTDQDTGTGHLELVTEAPRAYSNDGASDPRALDLFAVTDLNTSVLIRTPELTEVELEDGSYNDTISSGSDSDVVFGGYGDDVVTGEGRGDNLSGNEGDDQIYGGNAPGVFSSIVSYYDDAGLRYDQFGNLLPDDDDQLFGGTGQDLLRGSAGHDTLYGGDGDDQLSGGSGLDVLYGDLGSDQMSGGGQDDFIFGGQGDDFLSGGSGSDILNGETGQDTLEGGSGNDYLNGGLANDDINGGSGNDTIEDDGGSDRIRAGSGNDSISAGDGNDYINAGNGDDVIDGGAGRDRIYLGAGEDVASGGEGSDRFIFRSEDLDGSSDRIDDFTNTGNEQDSLDFSQLALLEDGQTQEDWMSQNVSQGADNSVVITLDSGTLTLVDHNNMGDQFLQSVSDAMIF